VRRMRGEGEGVTAIAGTTGLSSPTIYRLLVAGETPTVSGRKKARKPRRRARARGGLGESV